MSLTSQWLQELKVSEEQLQEIIRKLQPVIDRYQQRAPYDVIEERLINYGFTKFDAQKAMAVLYARTVLTETINAWDYRPFKLVKYMQLLGL
ncbi:hypothetical protein HSX37_13300|uniref:Uncharacterized protein n=1 Tax=Dendrosporobacter quercicolus TaxID=146817 RepID=A0A1H0AV25_9FIRM|nr:hypothetical protein [Dendrosporobacter quercicolus]NSL49010.1 hypothetical protein [Dendrosporobacter quercicolus DSM 1736]SDN37006.1 hypothetical protein SAMN04488502_1238 [Dendrosporobacter quercicolus]